MRRNRSAWLASAIATLGVMAATTPATAGTHDAKPKPKLVLSDDFSDDANGWGGDSQPGHYRVGVVDGTYEFELLVNESPPVRWPDELVPTAERLVNQRVEVDASWEGGPVPAPVCRANPDESVPDFSLYFFGVRSSDGTGLIVKVLEDGTVEKLAESRKPVTDVSSQDVRLGGDCVNKKGGVALTLRVDGKGVLTTTDDDDPIMRAGTPGLTAYSDAKQETDPYPLTVSYDEFKAFRLK